VPRPGPSFEVDERRLVGGPARDDDEPAAAGRAHGAERDRVGGPPDDDVRADPAVELHLVVEQHRPLRIRLGRGVLDELERLSGQLEQELPTVVLQDRPQLHEVGD
jgi:hypothetical protein